MLTKYILTTGSTEHVVTDDCLKNWDEIAFSLKRTDYSGVMRSFSTEFVFVGKIKDLLWELFLSDGFKASASIAVYTITNTHEWEKQYESTLDFSTIEVENGMLTINAMDNALASLLKSKKSQKYEYPVSSFDTTRVNISRVELSSYACYTFPVTNNPTGFVTALLNTNSSQIISKDYIEPCSEIADAGYGSVYRAFANVKQSGLSLKVDLLGTVRCYFCPAAKGASYGSDMPVSYLEVITGLPAEGTASDIIKSHGYLTCDDIQTQLLHGQLVNILVNSDKENVFGTLQELKDAAASRFGSLTSEHNGIFGVVGSVTDYTSKNYWDSNDIYEYQNSRWINKGKAANYYQDRSISLGIHGYFGSVTVPLPAGNNGAYVCLRITGSTLYLSNASMTASWSEPVRTTRSCRCIKPLQLITRIVKSITGKDTEVSIADDEAGLLASTLLLPGEELRQISDAKVYSTFQNFSDWMEAVFGYTYRVVDDGLQFLHRSAVFTDSVSKKIENFNDLKLSIVDDLIYSTVEAGYSKKEYGEIDGRLEKNFTNYYSTGYSLTDKKLSLISKYRADSYGIEFTARKSESETTDDKADEDVFFINYTSNASTGVNSYLPKNNDVYNPSVCVKNNKGFIAVFGNGKAVTLTMTSSDGNNALDSVQIAAGTALFTAAEMEFSTEDMEMPGDLNALVQLDYNGYRYTGYIKEAEARYGRVNGVEYKLIVKEITAL